MLAPDNLLVIPQTQQADVSIYLKHRRCAPGIESRFDGKGQASKSIVICWPHIVVY